MSKFIQEQVNLRGEIERRPNGFIYTLYLDMQQAKDNINDLREQISKVKETIAELKKLKAQESEEDNRGVYGLAADKEEMRALLNHLEDASYDAKWPSSFKVELSPYLLKKIGGLMHEYLIKILKEEVNK